MSKTNGHDEIIKFCLDGREVEARPDETIFQVAHRQDIKLPNLCYAPKPGYRPDGNCRVCMVEIEENASSPRAASAPRRRA
jgi:formate dehydrogenase major subunit